MKTMKLAAVLCDRKVFVSFAEARRACMKGHVKVNNAPVNDADTLIKTGDNIEVYKKWTKTVEIT